MVASLTGANSKVDSPAAACDKHQDRAIAGSFESSLDVIDGFHSHAVDLKHDIASRYSGFSGRPGLIHICNDKSLAFSNTKLPCYRSGDRLQTKS